MWLPFRDELDEAVHRDQAPWWKITGGAVATALVVVGWTLKERYQGKLEFTATTTSLILLGAAAAILGAGLSFSLLPRDEVRRRRNRGAHVPSLLALVFESRIVGVTILAALVAAAIFILGEWSDFFRSTSRRAKKRAVGVDSTPTARAPSFGGDSERDSCSERRVKPRRLSSSRLKERDLAFNHAKLQANPPDLSRRASALFAGALPG